MKTALVISDTHGNTKVLQRLVDIARESDYVIFCGDGLRDLKTLPYDVQAKVIAVSGNCDFSYDKNEKEKVLEIENNKILLTHGDLYGVKCGLKKLWERAKELSCNLAIYGHTHEAREDAIDGITLFCPGTIQKYTTEKSYGYIVFFDGKTITKIVSNEILNDY